ncbi:hypothetical protein F2Q69_00028287 [Brassica cretica]|uniref:Ubiquitin-like protease family profile domain-containing protein n=1 Tax=Brassica cretica TaxID=69181 RepID=A0A8S9RWG7_BRACR|nr:hypothetical protein F2Q69_00028287 [Brassica cretica]
MKPHKEASEEASEEAAAVASEEAAAEASEEVHTTVGGLTKEDIKTMFKDIVDAMRKGSGTCLKEIKYLSERVEAVEKKVGITTKRKGTSAQNTTPPKPTLEPGSESVNGTNAGRKSLLEDKGPDVPADASSSKDKAPEPILVLLDKNQSTVSDLQKEDARYLEKRDAALALYRAKSDRTRKLDASQQSPYTGNSTAKVIIPNKNFYPGYNPFAPIGKKKLKEINDSLKICPHYKRPLDKKPRTSRTWWYQILRTTLEWLEDCHIDAWINVLRKRYDANPQHLRSERMCFLDHLFAQQWRFNNKDFKDSEPDQNGLGRRLPGGAWNYYVGIIPSFCQSNKVWGMDIDDVYALVNYNDTHWIAMWISIPKRHIVVWDSNCSSISPEELDVVMESFLYMVPYLLVECASSDEQCAQYSLEPFTYERLTNIPPARAGDCGVYTLKYIECHTLGIEFSKKDFDKPNGKTMRDKMAVDIFQELPDAHEFINKDNDANLGAVKVLMGRTREGRACRRIKQSPYTANSTAKVIIPNKKLYPGYNPFVPIDKKKLKELADWLKTCPHYRTPLDKKPRTSRTWWYQFLRTSLEWLEDCRIDAWINVLRKRFNYKDFKDSEPDQNGLGKRLPGGAWNYYAGTIPSFCQSYKISIPKRHIVVWDNICSSISSEELDVVMEPFLYMVPYLLVECASSDEQRAQYSMEPFTYERPTNIPPARAGDCGMYSLKYI